MADPLRATMVSIIAAPSSWAAAASSSSSPPPTMLGRAPRPPICGSSTDRGSEPGAYVAVEAGIKAGSVLAVLAYMYYRRRLARTRPAASRALIFPFYYSLFFATAFVDVMTVALSLFYNGRLPPAVAALCWALSRLITEGLTVFLLHHGVGLATVQQSFTYAVMWALLSFLAWYFVPILRETPDTTVGGDVLALAYLTPPLLFYTALVLLPPRAFPRRPAVLPLAALMALVFATLVLREALLAANSFLPGPCLAWSVWSLALWAGFPLVVYHCLVIDSQWWQGLYHDRWGWAGGNLNAPLLDVWGEGLLEAPASELASLMHQLETGTTPATGERPRPSGRRTRTSCTSRTSRTSSGSILRVTAAALIGGSASASASLSSPARGGATAGLGEWEEEGEEGVDEEEAEGGGYAPPSLSLSHPEGEGGGGERVPIIPFGQLHLRTDRKFKSGSSSRVYQAEWKGGVVAVKMLFTMELDAEVLRAFIQEARVLYSLRRHPNLLRCLGVAIMPPAACLVTEYCSGGSLFEVLRAAREGEGETGETTGAAAEAEGEAHDAVADADVAAGGSSSGSPRWRRALLASYPARLRLMRDCAAGVAYLHRHGLVHGDIKSLNFLVTGDGTVKLGDVGEARPAGVRPPDGGPVHPTTINWAPPEVLSLAAGAYHPSMDMYSLGLVLNEILTLEVPFHRAPYTSWGYQDLITHIVGGGRPPLGTGMDPRAAEELRPALEACLEGDPALRPTAPQLQAMLKAHYQRVCGDDDDGDDGERGRGAMV